MDQYRLHPSISAICKAYPRSKELFEFQRADKDKIKKQVLNLKSGKATPQDDIPATILRENIDLYDDVLTSTYNLGCESGIFPSSLKNADVSALFKTGKKAEKQNYRPISKLPNFSKVFERIMFDDISLYMSTMLSPFLSGFRAHYSTQHALLSMIEKWYKELDKGNVVASVLMDLSKAFDCINHELLIAKLAAYGFSKSALHFVYSYLQSRSQRVGVESEYSSFQELTDGVPQGSILGPLLFNIYINDLFLALPDPKLFVCNYADDNTMYTSGKCPSTVMECLQSGLESISTWYRENGLLLNPDKCKLIVFKGNKKFDFDFNLKLGNFILKEVSEVKLLGIFIDNKLSYTKHIDSLCRKVSPKIKALRRIFPYISREQCKLISSSFVSSELAYCPLVWSFASKTSLNRIQTLQNRAEKLCPDSQHTCIHRKNCETLLKEVYKTKSGLNPSYMEEVFRFKEAIAYNTRFPCEMFRDIPRTTRYGTQRASFIGAQLWDSLPALVISADTLDSFTGQVSQLEPLHCKCRLCTL